MIDDEDHWSVHSRELNWMKDFMSINLTISPYALTEIMVPTCSYRMGETDIGYGVGVIGKSFEGIEDIVTVRYLASKMIWYHGI